MSGTRLATIGPFITATIWGGMYVVSKWGFAVIPPVTLAFLRVAIGGVALAVMVRVVYPPRSFTRSEWRRFIWLAIWVTLTLVTQFIGTDLTTASQGSLLTILTPIITVGLGVTLLDEQLTARKVLGIILAVIGTILVLFGQYDLWAMTAVNAIGIGTLLVAGASWAVYTVLGAPLVRRYSALETAAYSTMIAVPMLGVLVPIELWSTGIALSTIPVTPAIVGAVAYLGLLSTAAAWYLWYKGLEATEAGTVAIAFFFQPVVAALLGVLFLGETVGPYFLLGGLTMAIGIYAVNTARS